MRITLRDREIKIALHIWISSGYALGLIIEACTKYQEKHKANHADPVQVSCHFIASPDIVPYQVHIKTLKPGRSYTNLYAEFTQNVRMQPLFRKHEWEIIKETDFPGFLGETEVGSVGSLRGPDSYPPQVPRTQHRYTLAICPSHTALHSPIPDRGTKARCRDPGSGCKLHRRPPDRYRSRLAR